MREKERGIKREEQEMGRRQEGLVFFIEDGRWRGMQNSPENSFPFDELIISENHFPLLLTVHKNKKTTDENLLPFLPLAWHLVLK